MYLSSAEVEFEAGLKRRFEDRLYLKWNEFERRWEVWRVQGPKPTFKDSFIWSTQKRHPDERDFRWFREHDAAAIGAKAFIRQLDSHNAKLEAKREARFIDQSVEFMKEHKHQIQQLDGPSRSFASMHSPERSQ